MARKAADAEAKLKKEEAAAAAEMAEAAKTKFTKSKRKSTTPPRRSFAEASAVAASTHAGKSAPVEADDTPDWKARAEELEASIPGLQKEKDATEARMRDMEAQLQDLEALMRETKAKLDAVENENKQLRLAAEATNQTSPGTPAPPVPNTEQPQPEPQPQQQQPDPVTRDPARAALETHLIGINLQGLRKLMIFIQSLIPSGRFRNRVKDAVWKDGICIEEAVDVIVKSWEDLTTGAWVYGFVKTGTGSKRLAECSEIIDPADIGKPSYFISHAWKGSLAQLFEGIFRILGGVAAEEDTFVWIDFVAVRRRCNHCSLPLCAPLPASRLSLLCGSVALLACAIRGGR